MLKVCLEPSCNSALRSVFAEGIPTYFQLTDAPELANVIVFQNDDWNYIRRSELFRAYPSKCICISEWDKPSFFIPGLYASNEAGWLANGRAETTNFLTVARGGTWNPWVAKLSLESVEKKYLYSFIGKSTSRVRKHLLRHYLTRRAIDAPSDVLIETTDRHVHQHVVADARRYAEIMMASKYALCPRGWGTSSARLFEACEMGVAPVILADRWVPISGIDWTFAIFIEERQVREVDRIVRAHESEWIQRGQRARQTFLRHFATETAAQNLAEKLSRLMDRARPQKDAAIRRVYPLIHVANLLNERRRKWFVSYRP